MFRLTISTLAAVNENQLKGRRTHHGCVLDFENKRLLYKLYKMTQNEHKFLLMNKLKSRIMEDNNVGMVN